MTVHRVGPNTDQEQDTVTLGKILVTTDDLDALTDILRRRIYSTDALANKPEPKRHKVEFDGGYFDEVSDLSTLSDDEARSLRIQGHAVQVVLSRERAVAIGNKQEAEEVYKLWARSRQTRKPRPGQPLLKHPILQVLFFSLLVTPPATYVSLGINVELRSRPITLTAILVFLYFTAALALIFLLAHLADTYVPERFLGRPKPSYAVVVPYSLDEYRKNKAANKYPNAQTIVAVAAVIVAVVTGYLAWIKP